MSKWLEKFKTPKELWGDDKYKALFDQCSARINNFWSADLHQFVKAVHPDLAREIDESEARFEFLWDEASLNDFNQELERFYKLHQVVKDLYIDETS